MINHVDHVIWVVVLVVVKVASSCRFPLSPSAYLYRGIGSDGNTTVQAIDTFHLNVNVNVD